MGIHLAPSYANLFMSDFEDKFFYTYREQPLWWKQFIDDIFMLWTHGRDKLNEFITCLNSDHLTIKFTAHIFSSCVEFLVTLVKILSQNTIITDLFTKPTDSHNYLHYSSCHPIHTKHSLPYSQLIHIKRICTEQKDFGKHSSLLINYFLQRGYPIDILFSAQDKVRELDRDTLLSNLPKEEEKETDRFFSRSTYHPDGNLLKQVISTSWDYLSQSCATRDLHNHPVVYGHRRNKNLRDILVTANALPPKQPFII